jgi:hypothetical protein
MVWKFFVDELEQGITSTPVLLDRGGQMPGITSEEAYVVGFVRRGDYEGAENCESGLLELLSGLTMNMSRLSLEVCIKNGVVDTNPHSAKRV